MKSSKLFLASLATVTAVAAMPTTMNAAYEKPFTDVTKDYIFYNDITNLAARGVLNGYENGSFQPYQAVTRGQVAKIIATALDLNTVNVKDPGFKDVTKQHLFYGPIAALAEKGVISGYKGQYRPNEKLTRGQLAKIITLAFQLNRATELTHAFKDVTEKNSFKYEIQTLLDYGITKGTSATQFSPGTFVTRGQMAAFVVRSEQAVAAEQPGETPTEPTPGEPTTPTEPTPGEPTTPTEPKPPVLELTEEQKLQKEQEVLSSKVAALAPSLSNASISVFGGGTTFSISVLDSSASVSAVADPSLYFTLVSSLGIKSVNGYPADSLEAALYVANQVPSGAKTLADLRGKTFGLPVIVNNNGTDYSTTLALVIQ